MSPPDYTKCHICGNFYHLIKSMYFNCKFAVILPGVFFSHSYQPLASNKGVTWAQLWPIYSKMIFMIFLMTHAHPSPWEMLHLNSLSWADDLVLCSTTPNCLNKLEDCCHRWALTVNETKTKCLTFSVGRTRVHITVYYNNKQLEHVDTFTYLGIYSQSNGKFKTAINSRIAKANRALFIYKQALKTTGNVNTRLTMSIVDKQILPILTYGSPIWRIPDTTNYLTVYGTNNPQQGRHIINMITDKIIPTVWVRNTTSTRHPSVGVKVLLNVDNFGAKELILMTSYE